MYKYALSRFDILQKVHLNFTKGSLEFDLHELSNYQSKIRFEPLGDNGIPYTYTYR